MIFSTTKHAAVSVRLVTFLLVLLAGGAYLLSSCSSGSVSDQDVRAAFSACTAGIQAAASGTPVTTYPVTGETDVTQTSAGGNVVITTKDFPSSAETYWSVTFSNYTNSGYTISGTLSGSVSGYGSSTEVISQAGTLEMHGGPVTSLGFSTQSTGSASGPFTYSGEVVANGTKTVVLP